MWVSKVSLSNLNPRTYLPRVKLNPTNTYLQTPTSPSHIPYRNPRTSSRKYTRFANTTYHHSQIPVKCVFAYTLYLIPPHYVHPSISLQIPPSHHISSILPSFQPKANATHSYQQTTLQNLKTQKKGGSREAKGKAVGAGDQ